MLYRLESVLIIPSPVCTNPPWIRYCLRSPLVLMSVILLFWHVLVEFSRIGSGQGDSPGFLFVFILAPLYVVVYGCVAGLEYWVAKRDPPVPVHST